MISTIIQKEIQNNKEHVAVLKYLGQKTTETHITQSSNKPRYLGYHHGDPNPQNETHWPWTPRPEHLLGGEPKGI